MIFKAFLRALNLQQSTLQMHPVSEHILYKHSECVWCLLDNKPQQEC